MFYLLSLSAAVRENQQFNENVLCVSLRVLCVQGEERADHAGEHVWLCRQWEKRQPYMAEDLHLKWRGRQVGARQAP
jgi:hypothetical protein